MNESHRVFRHGLSNTVLIHAIHGAGETVNLVDLKSTRRMLDGKGLFPATEFDQLTVRSPRPSAAS